VRPRWETGPAEIVLVRHGHSTANAADDAAHEAGAEELDLDVRDADVELSDTGREQVRGLARWLAELDDDERPTLAVTSPFVRAAQTAELALEEVDVELLVDERLRERDMGVLDGLTRAGVEAQHPDEAARRQKLGKFWFQPQSGESWADVCLRVRSFLDELRHGYDGARVWLFTHQAVIMAFRYVLEDLSEQDVLSIDREQPVPNASVTRYRRKDAFLELDTVADTAHVERSDAGVTRQSSGSEHGHAG
jgi:broad specificity phosphatase PhoE